MGGAGERHLRRRRVGTLGQRDRGGPVARLQRRPPLAARQHPLERVPRAVGARAPAALVRRPADAGGGTARPAAVRPARGTAVPRPRHGLRGRLPHRTPFFLPVDPSYDTRLQALDNASVLLGRHLVKAGVEYNRTGAMQQFIGFANSRYLFDSVDGFMKLRDAGPPLRHLLGRVGQRRRRLPRRSRDHRTGAALPAVGDGAGGPPRPARAATAPHAGAGALPAGHVDPARPADARPRPPLGGHVAPRRVSSRRRIRSSRPISTIPLSVRRPDSPRPRQLPAPSGAGVGRRRRRTHGGAGQRRVLRRAHPDARLRGAPHHQRRLSADHLPQQRRLARARTGAAPRPADRRLGDPAVPAGHPGRRPQPGAAAHLVVQRRRRSGTSGAASPPASPSPAPGPTTCSDSSTATIPSSARLSGSGPTPRAVDWAP